MYGLANAVSPVASNTFQGADALALLRALRARTPLTPSDSLPLPPLCPLASESVSKSIGDEVVDGGGGGGGSTSCRFGAGGGAVQNVVEHGRVSRGAKSVRPSEHMLMPACRVVSPPRTVLAGNQ